MSTYHASVRIDNQGLKFQSDHWLFVSVNDIFVIFYTQNYDPKALRTHVNAVILVKSLSKL